LVGDPLRSKPLLDGETNRNVLVVGVANIPEKFVAVLELDSVESRKIPLVPKVELDIGLQRRVDDLEVRQESPRDAGPCECPYDP
jgi:autonomous glycyl radical cofactor GrcA